MFKVRHSRQSNVNPVQNICQTDRRWLMSEAAFFFFFFMQDKSQCFVVACVVTAGCGWLNRSDFDWREDMGLSCYQQRIPQHQKFQMYCSQLKLALTYLPIINNM